MFFVLDTDLGVHSDWTQLYAVFWVDTDQTQPRVEFDMYGVCDNLGAHLALCL